MPICKRYFEHVAFLNLANQSTVCMYVLSQPFKIVQVSSQLQLSQVLVLSFTLKTGIPIEEGDSSLKLLRRVSLPEIQLEVVFLF